MNQWSGIKMNYPDVGGMRTDFGGLSRVSEVLNNEFSRHFITDSLYFHAFIYFCFRFLE